MERKAQTNQVFVYLLSIILILFAGFLVTKFILTFSSDVDSRIESKIYTDLEKDFKTVYSTYGSEKVLKYRLTSNIDNICFISNSDCINELNLNDNSKSSLEMVFESGDNVALFNKEDIISSKNIGNFIVEDNNGCLCIKPKNSLFEIILENKRNQVYLTESN